MNAAERALKAGMATLTTRKRETHKQLGDALVQNGAIIAASLVTERTSSISY